MKSGLFQFLLRCGIAVAVFIAAEFIVRYRSKVDPPAIPTSLLARGWQLTPTRSTLWTSPAPRATQNGGDSHLSIMIVGEDNAIGIPSTQGAQRDAGLPWPQLLATLFERATGTHDVSIDVFATPGFTAVQGERLLARALEVAHPDIVLLAFGPTHELEPALNGHGDEYWLAHSGAEPHPTPSRLLDALRDFVENRDDRSKSEVTSVRLDSSRFERSLERMVASIRSAGACPAIVEPIARPADPNPTRTDAFQELYRLAANRVAGVYGVPLIELRDALVADRSAFQLVTNRLSDRGARLVAREVFRGLATDSAFLLAVQRWLGRHSERVEASLVAGVFGLLHSIYREGPAAIPTDAVRDHIVAALQQSQGELKRCAAWLTAIARHDDASLDASVAAFDAVVADPNDVKQGDPRTPAGPMVDQMRALSRILLGRWEEARSILAAPGTSEPSLDSLLRGIAVLTADPKESASEFAAAIEADPSLGLADLWHAKLCSIANDSSGEMRQYRLARTMIERHGFGLRGIAFPPPSDAAAVHNFLLAEPTLFGGKQRMAFPRLMYALYVESPTMQRDALTLLERGAFLLANGSPDLARPFLEAVDSRFDALSDEDRLTLGQFALEKKDPTLARRCAETVRQRSHSSKSAFLLGIVECEAGAFDRAIPLLEEFLATEPEQPQALFYLALARFNVHDAKGANDAIARALVAWPEQPDLKALRAKVESELHPK